MSLQIKARHCTIDDTLRSYVEKKLERIRRYYSKVHGIEVIFTDEKTTYTCEIEVIAPPMHVIATAEDKEIRASFDKAQKVVERNLKREKTRMIDSKRHGPETMGRPSAPGTPVDEDAVLEEIEAEFEEQLEEGQR